MRLRWTPDAAEDLYRIVRYIQQNNPTAASRVADALVDGCERLLRFPRAGRTGAAKELVNLFLRVLHTSWFTESQMRL